MQRKIKRKFVSLILAASLAVSSLAAFPMNVFAGTGKNGVKKAPYNVISIQDDSSYCMKKGNQVELKKTLGEGAEFAVFVSENPDVATVNDNGTVTAVGPGEATITVKAKLKGSNQIHTATCRVIVTGLIAEVMQIYDNGCTVKGTVYGKNGVKAVDGKVSKIDIRDVIEIAEDNKTVNIKDTVMAQNGSSVSIPFCIDLSGSFNIQDGGSINLNGSSIEVYRGSFNVQDGGSINVNSGGSIRSNGSGSYFKINVNSGGTVNVQDGGSVWTRDQGQIPSGTYHGPLTWNFG